MLQLDPREMGSRSYLARRMVQTGKEIAKGVMSGHDRWVARQIDAKGELHTETSDGAIIITDPVEFATRRKAFYSLRGKQMAQKSNEVRAAKKLAAEKNRIHAIANPPHACAICLAEQNTPMPHGATHQTCAAHAAMLVAEQQIMAQRAEHLASAKPRKAGRSGYGSRTV